MVDLSDAEYQELKKFFFFYCDHYIPVRGLSPEKRIANIEELEKRNYKRAVQGLRQAFGDILESTKRLDPAEVKKIDAALENHNLVTLSDLRRRFSRVYANIVKRGRIRNETEYHLVRGIIESGSQGMTSRELDNIGKMIAEFEEKFVKLSEAVRRGRTHRS
jgi:hypothetical protein